MSEKLNWKINNFVSIPFALLHHSEHLLFYHHKSACELFGTKRNWQKLTEKAVKVFFYWEMLTYLLCTKKSTTDLFRQYRWASRRPVLMSILGCLKEWDIYIKKSVREREGSEDWHLGVQIKNNDSKCAEGGCGLLQNNTQGKHGTCLMAKQSKYITALTKTL